MNIFLTIDNTCKEQFEKLKAELLNVSLAGPSNATNQVKNSDEAGTSVAVDMDMASSNTPDTTTPPLSPLDMTDGFFFDIDSELSTTHYMDLFLRNPREIDRSLQFTSFEEYMNAFDDGLLELEHEEEKMMQSQETENIIRDDKPLGIKEDEVNGPEIVAADKPDSTEEEIPMEIDCKLIDQGECQAEAMISLENIPTGI